MRSRWIALVLLAAACGKNEKPPPQGNKDWMQESGPTSKQPAANEAVKNFFVQTCSLCHGTDGSGTGPMAAQLNPKPRNYTDPDWQASVTDDDIKQIIVLGGAGVGKSASMPPNPGLKGDDATLDALVKIIRGFAKKK
jgi:mono/diheme cytochrome c family protein